MREWFYTNAEGKQYGPMLENQLSQFVQSFTLDPDELWGFSFRCFGSSKWVGRDTFLRLVEPEVGTPDFAPGFFDNPDEEREPIFFSVSQSKFSLMILCTLGLYYFFWAYKTWSYFRKIDIRSDNWYTPLLYIVGGFLWPAAFVPMEHLPEYWDIGVGTGQLTTYLWPLSTVRALLISLGFVALVPFAQVFIIFPHISSLIYLPIVGIINDINAKRVPGYTLDDHLSRFQRVWAVASFFLIMGGLAFLSSLWR